MEDLQQKIIELMDLFDDEEVTTADKIDRPQRALDREAIDDFMKRNPMAGGGMLVQPSADGSRPGYAKIKETKAMNYGNIKKKEDSIQSYIDNFGEDLLNKMSKTKYKKNFKNLTGDNLKNFKRRVTKFKDFISENKRMPNETEAREIGRAPRTLKEADLQIKLLNATNKTNFFDPKKFIKDNNITMSQLRSEAKKLQRNIYKKRMILSGKEDVRAKLKWLPDDPTFSDNALNKLWKSNLIKYEREKIDELFYDAFGREFVKGTKDKNPTYNPRKFLAIKNNLNEYRQLRDAIQLKYPNIRFELDHPLSKSSLNKIFNATTDQLTRVNILEADLNNGFKDSLSLQYEKAVQGNDLKKKKAVEKIARDLKLNIGKISDDATNFKYGVKEFQKLNIKEEIAKSLENLSFLNKNFQTYAKNNPELFKTAGVSTNQTFTKVDNIKGLSAFMKNLGIKCQLSNGINCSNPQAYEKSLNELSTKAQAGDQAAAAKMTNFAKSVRGAGSVIKGVLGPAALVFEAGIAVPIGLFEYSQGKPATEIVNSLTYGLFGKSRDDRLKEQMPAYGQVENLQNIDQRIQDLGRLQEGTRGQKLRSKPKFEKAKEEFQTAAEPFLSLENPVAGMLENLKQSEDLRQKLIEEDLQRKQERKTPFDLSDPFMAAKGGRAGFKSGALRKGIQALIDKSVKSTPKDTTPDLDALIKKALDEDFFDKKDRIVDTLNAKIARERKNFPYNQQVFEEPSQLDFYDAITKSNFKTKTGPFFDYQKRKNKAGGGLLKQAGDRSSLQMRRWQKKLVFRKKKQNKKDQLKWCQKKMVVQRSTLNRVQSTYLEQKIILIT